MASNLIQFRTWCHINEFRKEGYHRLPAMIALSQPLSLWSPSARLMDEYHKKDPAAVPMSSRDLIEYVRRGNVCISGRKEWLMDPDFRNHHPWRKYARWFDEFDEQIREIAVEDMHLPAKTRRVRIIGPETGAAWADSVIVAGEQVVKEAEELIRTKRLPPGFSQRIRGIDLPWNQKVKEVLRCWKNHHEAISETDSDLAVFPWDQVQPHSVDSVPLVELRQAEKWEESSEELVNAAVRLMEKIEAFPKVEYLDELLKNKYRNDLILWLARACEKNSSLRIPEPNWALRHFLKKSMEAGLLSRKPIDYLIPKTWIERGLFAGGAIQTAMTAILGSVDPKFWSGLFMMLTPVCKGALELKSILPLSSKRYNGPQWPFICTTGKTAYMSQFTRIINKLSVGTKS